MIKSTNDSKRIPASHLYSTILKLFGVYARRRAWFDLWRRIIKIMKLRRPPGIPYSTALQQLSSCQATRTTTTSTSSCTGSRRSPRAAAGRKESRRSTARKTYGWWSPQPWTRARGSRYSEIWGISSSSSSVGPLQTPSGSFKSTSSSLFFLRVENLT